MNQDRIHGEDALAPPSRHQLCRDRGCRAVPTYLAPIATRRHGRIRRDDGFVAYLNGTKIADSYAPATLTWNAAATPSAFDYKTVADNDSMYNTPPTYAIYIAGLVFKWLQAQGGLAAMEVKNRAKAALLYDYLDSTSFYASPVARADRSLMNVPFHLKDPSLDEAFLKGAQARGLAAG